MQRLTMGANAHLPAPKFELAIEWPASVGTLDSSTYLLDGSGKVRSDDDMIFYNQPADASGAVRIVQNEAGETRLAIDLDRIPADVERIVSCVTIETAGLTMNAFPGTSASVYINGSAELSFSPELDGALEVAMRLVQLYRRDGAWKIRADGQGFHDGLAPLARSFGIDVADDDAPPERDASVSAAAPVVSSAPPMPNPAAPALPATPVAPIAPPPQPEGTHLTTSQPTHHWPKQDPAGFSAMLVKLAWTSQCGGMQGRPRPLKLALGCFYELENGATGALQIGDSQGHFETEPYLHLAPIEYAGTDGSQSLRINGEHWRRIRRLALYAYNPWGAPSWNAANVSLTLSCAMHHPVSVAVDYGVDGNGAVGVLALQNRDDGIDFRQVNMSALGQPELAADLGWRLPWSIQPIDFRERYGATVS